MPVKKSVLYSKLWDSCNTLRSKGGMDATQYKDYVLIVLFMKVITDKYYHQNDSLIDVPDDANFNTMISLKGKKNIGEEFNKILAKIAEENDLQNVIDVVDFNDENKLGKGKDMIEALTGLVEVFQDPELDFSNNRADDNDVLGDAYEYLMKKFASEAGKSKGQFYTPSEVSRIMSKILKISESKKSPIEVYDMTCGSGSLLIKAGDETPENLKVYLYGQEKDTNTAGLCVMNMFLHGNATAQIKVGNTLTNPQFLENRKVRTFDFCVANPPFSVKKWNTDLTTDNNYDRFTGFGTPPNNCGDYAFLLHMLKSMDPVTGRGAIILPHGVLFRGGQEELIRKNLLKSGFIEGIIGLPSNLFYGTGIPACIIILDKKDANDRKNVFMIDASKFFVKDGNKNRLREEDIRKITDTYLNKTEIEHYSKNVLITDIEKEEYNLNIPRYIDSSDEEVIQDIKAHLFGGIPKANIDKLSEYWDIAPKLKNKLFNNNERDGYLDLMVDKDSINEEITNSEEFINYSVELSKKVNSWEQDNKNVLYSISKNSRAKDIINILADTILKDFTDGKLIDKYEAYEFLMEYYNDTMKDDIYLIIENGWIPKIVYAQDKKGKIKENEFDSDLLPKEIVINEYFKNENDNIVKLNNDLNDLSQEFDSMVEENTGDEEIFNDEDKVSEKLIKDKIKEESDENIAILNKLLENLSFQKEIKNNIKKYQKALNILIIDKYNSLDEDTSKDLIIIKKWFKSIERTFNDKYEDLIYDLSNKIINEYENYENTLSQLSEKTSNLESLVLKDLERMDFESNKQKLLNNKKRNGKWKNVKIGDIGVFDGNGVDKTINEKEKKVRLLNYMDIMHNDFIYDNMSKHFVTASERKYNKCLVKKGDIFLTPSSETRKDIGVSAVALEDSDDLVYSYHIVRFRPTIDMDMKFRAYLFQNQKFLNQASKYCEGSGKRYVCSNKKFASFELEIPLDINEQAEIGRVLYDMESEIEILKEKLSKYQKIKEAMMEDLLTGKVRLSYEQDK